VGTALDAHASRVVQFQIRLGARAVVNAKPDPAASGRFRFIVFPETELAAAAKL